MASGGGLFQPVGQVRFTNVAIVKYKKQGKRFEVTCYRNKVVNWRNKVETDVDEVLQAPYVFTNASKGIQAKASDLKSVFGTDDHLKCCLFILEKGELQVSDKEREVQLDSMFHDVATIIADKCINPDTGIPHPVSVIEAAMKELHFSVSPKVSTKRQALEMIPRLRELIPLQRKHMRMRARVPAAAAQVLLGLLPQDAVVESNTEVDIHRVSGMPWASAVAAGSASEASAQGAKAPGRTIDFTAEPEQLRRLRTWGEALDAYKLHDIVQGEYMPEDDEALLAEAAASESSKAQNTKKGKKNKKSKKAAVHEPSPVEAADAADVPPEVRAQWFPVSVDVLAMTVETAASAAGGATTALGDRDIMSLGTIRVDGGASGDPSMDAIAGAVASSGGRVVSQAAPVQPVVKASSGAALVCRKCAGAEFASRDEYRAHFRSQWHTLNLKRALMSLPPVDEQRMAGLSEEKVQDLLKEATPQ